jgi:methionyl-tRNA formyltransferase
MRKIKIVYCGYREWALEVFDNIKINSCLDNPMLIKSKEEYDKWISDSPHDLDFILFVGWSWIVPVHILKKYLCLGIHPSDLPDFRGGSPIQNQIISGISRTKVSLITLAEKIDEGDIWLKEELSLQGDNIRMIFGNIASSSIRLLNNFFSVYPDIQAVKQNTEAGSNYRRRKPEDSKLSIQQMEKMGLEELYNFIRCLSDPYPNAYLEDEHGNRLCFKEVSFYKAQD